MVSIKTLFCFILITCNLVAHEAGQGTGVIARKALWRVNECFRPPATACNRPGLLHYFFLLNGVVKGFRTWLKKEDPMVSEMGDCLAGLSVLVTCLLHVWPSCLAAHLVFTGTGKDI